MDCTNLLGIGLDNMAQLIFADKHDLVFSIEAFNKNITRLTNQLWKVIPMRENNEDWKKQLETVLIEINGLNELFFSYSNFLQLVSKIEGLISSEVSFELYRKTVFEAINLLQELKRK